METLTSPGYMTASGWALQKGTMRPCAGPGCRLYVRGTSDYVRGPIYCRYCDLCRPGSECGCDVCQRSYPVQVPAGEPF